MEEILFDADRDNNGKGLSVEQIVKALKKSKRDQKLENKAIEEVVHASKEIRLSGNLSELCKKIS